MKRVVQLAPSINFALSSENVGKSAQLTEREIESCRKTVEILGPFCEATDRLQCDTANLLDVFKIVSSLRKSLSNVNQVDCLVNPAKQLEEFLQRRMNRKELDGHASGCF